MEYAAFTEKETWPIIYGQIAGESFPISRSKAIRICMSVMWVWKFSCLNENLIVINYYS